MLSLADSGFSPIFLEKLPEIFSCYCKGSRVPGTKEYRFFEIHDLSDYAIPYVAVTTVSSSRSYSDGMNHEYRNIIRVLHDNNADFEKEVRETLAQLERKEALWISGEELKERMAKALLEGRIVLQ